MLWLWQSWQPGSYNSDLTTSLGTSICHKCGYKKTEEKEEEGEVEGGEEEEEEEENMLFHVKEYWK